MSDVWSFKVSSELKNILGRDLITDSNIAILELVKNSFDAHATEVKISFLDDSLIISDNGKGMSEEDILNKWLFVAYSAKSDGTEDKDYRNTIKRKYAGAKGIGRLSCDRLGRFLTLITKSQNDINTIELCIDWNDFELSSKDEFDQIPVKHSVSSSSRYFPKNTTGTILKFTGLHDKWDAAAILRLKKSLEKLINPFSGADQFKIIFDVPAEIENDNRKIEECSQLKAKWDQLTPYKQQDAINKERSIINGPLKNTIAETLNLKTTRIDSTIRGNRILTKLSDRGVTIYEIEEYDKYPLLEDVSISLFYLNHQAKYNFSILMGTAPVNYGSVFLFRNGFRIMPYGEFGDDSWGLDQRIQQGYSRFLGTRQILGRVDVETEDKEAFKEVSSRDGGLINTPSFQQLLKYFNSIHRRLERYVVGVLWGEAFLRKDYFQKKEVALDIRNKLQGAEKNSENMDHVLANIGSRIDFLQLVKSLVNDESINLINYNEDLANILADVDSTKIIQDHFIEDFRKIANKTNDSKLLQNLLDFEEQIDILRRQKIEADKKADEERKRAKEALRKANEEKEKREQEEERRKKAEKERDAQVQQNRYLKSVRNTSKEVEDIIHAVMLSATEISSFEDILEGLLEEETLNRVELKECCHGIRINLNRINTWSQLITRADTRLLRETIDVDIISYCKEFMAVFKKQYSCTYINNYKKEIIKKISILDFSLVLLNLISNCGKNNSRNIRFTFDKIGNSAVIQISDDGDGVDLELFTAESIFEVGVTNRPGGSGIGLSTVRSIIKNSFYGSIEFIGNGLNSLKGATFQIILN